ncbi:hypothetical protein [Leifsonia sp. AG29]|uniref:hypothetical protein n=1 Tax=Leifsonia sp. AG29 TaxID=2598860 RepID=UPI001E5F1FCB|nr:hypothetical protein [Leifsonia sp. AG29]
MSPEFHIPSIDLPTEYVSWSSPAADLWVASTPSAYVGMVDRSHDGFVGTDHAGRDVGVHATLQEARTAVYRAWVEPEASLAQWAGRFAAQEAADIERQTPSADAPALDAVA